MSKDGRLTVRFGVLRPEVDAAAKAADRDPSDWVRVQIHRLLRRRKAKGLRKQAANPAA